MTAAVGPEEKDSGSPGSVRHASGGLVRPMVAMVLLLLATEIVHGIRIMGPAWQGGDLLYHSALAHAVLRGELPPGGPYAGLPAYYPPGFHVMLAAAMGGLNLDAVRADQLLTLAWLPVLPIGTFLLVRRLSGRPWVAVLAAGLTVFAGAYDLRAGRLWVNSLFMAGHEAYPLYPRDVVFGLLPFAVLAFLRALATTRTSRAWGWALAAGGLLGVGALVQVQLLLPIPVALTIVALAVAIRRPGQGRRAAGALVVTGGLALTLVAPWLVDQLDAIGRNGGVALDSSDTVVPARFGPWSYPREFGLLLPFGLLGAGATLLLLRRADGPRPGGQAEGPWRPARPEEGLVLVAWFGLAFALGVLYQPDWPLEDALRPQRLWLIASQPMTALAAIGLVAGAEDLVGHFRAARGGSRAAVAGLVGAATLVACVPTTFATTRLIAGTWTSPTYAALDLHADHVPAFDAILPTRGPRTTVLTYEDWSSLAWYETGATVAGLLPAGFAKLAYDPAVFTGRGQAERRADLIRAFDGDPTDLSAVANAYDAGLLVLARREQLLGRFDAMAVPAAAIPGALNGSAVAVVGNGWDALAMEPGATLQLPLCVSGSTRLEIRLVGAQAGVAPPARRFQLQVLPASGPAPPPLDLQAPATRTDLWQVIRTEVALEPGDRLVLAALNALAVQSIRGFGPMDGSLEVGAEPIPGWRVTDVTQDAVVLETAP